MKRELAIILFLTTFTIVAAQEKDFLSNIYNYLENTKIFELNQEDGHVPLVPYLTVPEALKNNYKGANYYLTLNGSWKFHFADSPEGAPDKFFSVNFNDKNWDTIHVPSNWEMEGFGDPVFRSSPLPFPGKPPLIPKEDNPTGSYRRSFNIPASWKNKEVFLRMEKTASAAFVWINGREVGYNEGAHEPAEFNITKYLKPGNNIIAVSVYKYSDGYYLEDQDYWRLSGIFDDVWLFAAPATHIFDWYATTDLDKNYTDAQLGLSFTVKNYSASTVNDFTIRTTLFDPAKRVIKTLISEKFSVQAGNENKKTVSITSEIKNPEKWSAEFPNLYTLIFELLDSKGNVVEVINGRTGFRKTEIRNQVFYLNGMPVKLNGINSHMQHPTLGHAMDEKTIRKDLELLKQFNINCVRTSHYPPAFRYLELADEYGLYIIDEAGVEAHATEYVSMNKDWEQMYRERSRKMVLRDRNHPSVLFWSAGNESGEGDNICNVIDEGKKYDKTRYWMYGGNAFSHKCEEIIGPRYPQLFDLVTRVFNVPENIDKRPSFLDEYLALTGNSGGGLDEYWELFYESPRIMGGALWDLVSPGITEKVRSLKDRSENNVQVNIMGRAKLVPSPDGKGIDLNGHDQWVEVYRDDVLEISGNQLTLSFQVFPRALNNSEGTLLTKGNWQFGIHQIRKDSLEFYITTSQRQKVQIALPENWENNWHQVIAQYNGSAISLFVDEIKSNQVPVTGNIRNFPFAVNIGRNAEIHRMETVVPYICDAIIDQVGIFNRIVPPDQLKTPSPELKKAAALWLDFEDVSEGGEFYNYGIGARTYGAIWPDRRPKPLMWQIKKSGQPVIAKLISAEKKEIEITNRFLFTNLNQLQIVWMLQADSEIIETGVLPVSLEPLKKTGVLIPFTKPVIKEGTGYRLLISFRQKEKTFWSEPGFEIAWSQFDLQWYKQAQGVKTNSSSLIINEDKDNLIISGKEFAYTFNKKEGTLASIKLSGKDIIKRGPSFNIWRAPLANETDMWTFKAANFKHKTDGYGRMASGEWYAAGLDKIQLITEKFNVITQDENNILIEVKNIILLGTGKGAFMNNYLIHISSDGELTIDHSIIPNGDMPSWLPRIGVDWILDKSLSNVQWYGRGPQENYPDRKTGYKVGIYKSTAADMYEPYLMPEDYGLRCDNKWVRVTDAAGIGLEFKGDKLFNFSIHPYSTENLTKAMYTYQLHPFDGIIFNFDYATSGVGSTDLSVLPEYQVLPQRFDYQVTIKPVLRSADKTSGTK